MEPANRRCRTSTDFDAAEDDDDHINTATTSSWSSLPGDLVAAIAGRLDSLEDFFSVRAVCHPWRCHLPFSPTTLSSQPPLLLLPSSEATLLDLPRGRHLRFRLPWPPSPSRLSLSYTHGFLVTTTTTSPAKPLLLHLLSGRRIRLPKTPFPFSRFLLSSSHLAVLFSPSAALIQYCRLGDLLWKRHLLHAHHVLDDMLFFDGTLYALVNPGCHLAVLDLAANPPQLSVLSSKFAPGSKPPCANRMLGEAGGQLLMVSLELIDCRVYRWEFGCRQWMPVASLGGRALFLGDGRFAASIVPTWPGIRGDCLYEAGMGDEWFEYSLEDGAWRADKANVPRCLQLHNLVQRSAVWVFPSLC